MELADFEIVAELDAREHRRVLLARYPQDQSLIHLTVFSSEISRNTEFRRAFKTDRAMLSMLRHQSIARFLGSGESDGQIFYWTEVCESEVLSNQLQHGRRFSTDDIVEIGWQICSALQQSHNFGLTHSGVSADSVRLSESLQVTLIEFGVRRWLDAAARNTDNPENGTSLITISALASQKAVHDDLISLAELLRSLQNSAGPEVYGATSGDETVSRSVSRSQLERLLNRVCESTPASRPLSAREFQGRLGEILIGGAEDSMPLVDQREIQGTTKRSIVVELFDTPPRERNSDGISRIPAASAFRTRILPIILIVAAIVVVTLVAGFLVSAAKAAEQHERLILNSDRSSNLSEVRIFNNHGRV